MTLIEVLVALALLAVLTGGLFAFVSDLGRQRDSVSRHASRTAAGSVVFDRVERTLATVLAAAPDGSGGLRIADGELVAVSARSRSIPDAGGLTMLRVSGAGATGTTGSSGVVLEETAVASGAAASSERFASLGSVRFRAYDGTVWHETYDSAADGGLPELVEVSIVYARDEMATDASASAPASTTMSTGGAASVGPGLGSDSPAVASDRWRVFSVPDPAPAGGRGE